MVVVVVFGGNLCDKLELIHAKMFKALNQRKTDPLRGKKWALRPFTDPLIALYFRATIDSVKTDECLIPNFESLERRHYCLLILGFPLPLIQMNRFLDLYLL